jgi:uncharacterized protein
MEPLSNNGSPRGKGSIENKIIMAKKIYRGVLAPLMFLLFMGSSALAYDGLVTINDEGERIARIAVELAATTETRRVGLMNRDNLKRNTGMLFDFKTPQPIHMWMKSTLIPLDMIFVDGQGKIIWVHENAIPHDLTVIPSNGDARWVLEVNAGFAKKHHLHTGQDLIYSAANTKK